MKDPGFPIRKAYRDALQGMTVGGSAVKVYDDLAIQNGPYPYVVLSTQTMNDDTCLFNTTIQVKVVTGYIGPDPGGRVQSDNIVDALLEKLATAFGDGSVELENGLLMNDWYYETSLTTPPYTFGSYTVRERVLIFRSMVSQLTSS